jgi:hypothetical protein
MYSAIPVSRNLIFEKLARSRKIRRSEDGRLCGTVGRPRGWSAWANRDVGATTRALKRKKSDRSALA